MGQSWDDKSSFGWGGGILPNQVTYLINIWNQHGNWKKHQNEFVWSDNSCGSQGYFRIQLLSIETG